MPATADCNTPTRVRSAGVSASEALFAPLRGHLRQLDAFLDAQVGEFEPVVRELVAYTFAHRGKRLRPLLVFYAAWTGHAAPPAQEVVRAAAIVELVHLATLVHDDILDNADIRHNSSTVVAKFGAHSAVLLGDALFAHALILASQFPSAEVCRLVSAATRQVVSGEICQTFARGDTRLSIEEYFRIIRLKTAELFALSCRLGALLATGDTAYADACADYGRHLGTGYQIFDDVADLIGDERGIGKTLGTDFDSGKFTLPVLLYLQQLKPEAALRISRELETRTLPPAELVAKIRATGAAEQCQRLFQQELAAANAALEPFAQLPSIPELRNLTNYIDTCHQNLFA